jgi:hypothetical protein
MNKVAGECPMGCGKTLFLGDGGHVTCSLIGCKNPTAADQWLTETRTGRFPRVTVHDPANGDIQTAELPPDEYIVLCGEGRFVDGVQVYPKAGTVVATIKRIRREAAA